MRRARPSASLGRDRALWRAGSWRRTREAVPKVAALACGLLALAPSVRAGELRLASPGPSLSPRTHQAQPDPNQPDPNEPDSIQPDAAPDLDLSPARLSFGQVGFESWSLGAALADNFDDATDLNVLGSYGVFFAPDVEFAAEGALWHFNQDGDNAIGFSPSIVFRWHFYNDGAWSLYADAGIGLLFTTDEVPDGGTSVNFVPRLGAGFTRLLDADSGLRLQAGARWHHVSNARILGDDRNPARDGVLGYITFVVPF